MIRVFSIDGGRETVQHIALVYVPERVCEMRCKCIAAIDQEGLEIRAILIELACLRDRHTIYSDVTLTERRV